MTNAGMQVEGQTKFENQLQFTTASTNVQTIATFIKASIQIMDDLPELEGFLRTSLPYYVNRQEDSQIISGDGTGNNLNGLVTQASSFNLSLLQAAAGYTRIDQIGAAAEQVQIADEIRPSFVVLNPRDWWNIRRTKDNFGRYILGDPQITGDPKTVDGLSNNLAKLATGQKAAFAELFQDIGSEIAEKSTKDLIRKGAGALGGLLHDKFGLNIAGLTDNKRQDG